MYLCTESVATGTENTTSINGEMNVVVPFFSGRPDVLCAKAKRQQQAPAE